MPLLRNAWLVPVVGAALVGVLSATPAGEVEVASVVVNLIAEVDVAAEEAGPLVELAVSEGSRVKVGDRLARLHDRDAALKVERAEIALRNARELAQSKVKLTQAEEVLKVAKLELDRATSANQGLANVVSPTQISKLQLEVRRAELNVEQAAEDRATAARAVGAAANEVALAQRALERRQILAPLEGVVVDVRMQPGEWLEPGKAVVRLVRDDRLRATGFVRIDQLTSPLEGKPALLVVELPGAKAATFTGRVTFVSPEANPINRQVRLIAEFDNHDGRLRAGLPAKMTIQIPAAVGSP
jgi:RND family efflux transporter MFP subunit